MARGAGGSDWSVTGSTHYSAKERREMFKSGNFTIDRTSKTAKNGYQWLTNGASRFGGKRKSFLAPESEVKKYKKYLKK